MTVQGKMSEFGIPVQELGFKLPSHMAGSAQVTQ
jgi:hypothetical protein